MKHGKGARVAKSPGRPGYARVVSLLLCVALALTLIPNVPFTLGLVTGWDEASHTYTIDDFNSLIGAAEFSVTETGCKSDVRYVLANDIVIGDSFLTTLDSRGVDHLTFGDAEHPFRGTFDGQGFSISGLNYKNRIFKVAMRTGLFSYTRDATVKNLTIKHADMHADTINGILVGEAYNTRFENVTVEDSFTAVNPADNALLLITDGGVIGGGMVGYANHCSFYNCQVSGTNVVVNSVSGVAALSGKGLFLGGLVGAAVNETYIEYSRVTATTVDGARKGKVSNRYESSVGALGGFILYSGGLVGTLEGNSYLIDCFATCDVSFHAATYVGVGAGCSGNVGGLVARDKESYLIRSHYAGGTLSSYQYNTLLLFIPVQIDRDIYISGLAEEFEGNKALRVQDCFFNEKDTLGPSWGEKPDVLHNGDTTSEYGPQPDERYMDRAFWESHGYDFTGTVDRAAQYGQLPLPHTNKWVMYYYDDPVLDRDGNPTGETVRRGYPVHGQSVAATFDFPGAGEVSLSSACDPADSLTDGAESTTDPYRFAVLGFYPTERQVTVYEDGRKTGGVNLSIALNEGYRLVNWYKEENVTAAGLPEEHDYFERLFAQESKKTGLGAVNRNLEVEDNQLYAAYCQARVEFHDLKGSLLNVTGVENANGDNYYDYAAPLPDVVPAANAPDGENVKLIGWTTRKHAETGDLGWPSVTTSDLKTLREDGVFYLPGEPITKALQLYPVYANQLLNIKPQIEGYDSDTNKALRAGVGEAHVNVEEGRIVLHVQSLAGENAADHTDGADFPDGYRFLGWYEDGLCVSRERDYTLPETVDLNVEHVYEARFTYRVDYYLIAHHYAADQVGTPFVGGPCTQLWQLYNSDFNASASLVPEEYHYGLSEWREGAPTGIRDNDCAAAAVPTGKKITAPYVVHAHTTREVEGSDYNFYITTDFPDSGNITQQGRVALNSYIVEVEPHSNYNFLFWALGRPRGHHETSGNKRWDIPGVVWGIEYNYGIEAHMTANVVFHTKDGGDKATVQRRYKENVFLDADTAHTYKYPISALSEEEARIDTDANRLSNPPSEKFPFTTDMTVSGYHFIGWLDRDDPDLQKVPDPDDPNSKNAWDTIYNVPGDPCTTTNVDLAKQYVLKPDAVVTRAMPNLYPVYAKYDVKTATNVFLEIEGELNKPQDPAYRLEKDTDPSTTVTVTAYNHVAVHDHVADGETQEYYDLEAVTLSVDGGATVTLASEKDGAFVLGEGVTCVKEGASQNWKLTYEVRPGTRYVFTAVYKPYVVVYHVNGDDGPKVLVRSFGDAVGRSFLPEIQSTARELDRALFVGWTEARPEDTGNRPYHFFEPTEEKTSYQQAKEFGFRTLTQTEDTIVTRSMEFWPVFAAYTVSVNSNIDRELKENQHYTDETLWEKVRSLVRETPNTVSTTVHAKEVVGYKFDGWYTGVTQSTPGGEFDNFDNAKAISGAEVYTLQNEEPFATDNAVYTARYRRVYKVNYHGPKEPGSREDSIYFTDYLLEGVDEGRQLNETVTRESTRLDENGNEYTVTDEYQKPLNSAPYFEMYKRMTKHQVFGQWYRFTEDGRREVIYEFDQKAIIPTEGRESLLDERNRELDLYPSIWTATVRDASGAVIQPEDDLLTPRIGMTQEGGVISAYTDILFNPKKPYTQSELTVHVDRSIWLWNETAPAPEVQVENQPNVAVTLFPDGSQPHDPEDKVPFLARENTNAGGDAVFRWLSGGALRVVKNAPASAKDETFLFQITDTADPAKTWQAAVTCATPVYEDADHPGKVTGYTGQAELLLPLGSYKVEEKADWAAQYAPTYTLLDHLGAPLAVDTENAPIYTNAAVPIGWSAIQNANPLAYTQVVCKNVWKADVPTWLTHAVQMENPFTGVTAP